MESKLETVYKQVCNICGASYHHNKSMHTRATGHNDWKRVKEIREASPSTITWNIAFKQNVGN